MAPRTPALDRRKELICTWTPQGRFLSVNRAYCRYFGVSEEEFKRLNLFSFIPPPADRELRKLMRSVSSVQPVFAHETRTVIPSKGVRWILWSNRAFFSRNGRMSYVLAVGRDITDKKKIEREVEWRASFPELNPSPVFEADYAGRISYLNPSARALRDSLGPAVFSRTFLSGLGAVRTAFQRQGKNFIMHEVRLGEKWLQEQLYHVRELKRIRIYCMDITPQKQMMQELERTKDILVQTVDQRTAELIETNEALKREVGERRQVEKEIRVRNALLKLALRVDMQEYLDAAARLLRGWSGCRCAGIRVLDREGGAAHAAFVGFTPDNWEQAQAHASQPWFFSQAVLPLRFKEKTLGAVYLADEKEGVLSGEKISFVRELALRIGEDTVKFILEEKDRSSSQLLEKIFSNASVLIASLDKELRFIRVNEAYAAADGKPAAFFPGKSHFEMHPDAENEALFRKVMETGKPFLSFARPYVYRKHPERGVTYWDWNLQPVKDGAGNVEGVVMFLTDVTQRTRAEQELQAAHKELTEAKRLSDVGFLAATVAHELRNPLAAIQMAAHNIRRKAGTPLLASHIETIEKKVAESDQIINNLLGYSRTRPPHLRDVFLHQALSSCVLSARQRYRNSGVRVIKKIRSLKTVVIQADPLQVEEVLNNLLNNAFDSFEAGPGAIEIGTEVDAQTVKVRIKDSGVGMDEEEVKQAFVPFFTTKAKGTGLGLAVCKQIMGLHGGSIELESYKGEGTTVTLLFPRHRHEP